MRVYGELREELLTVGMTVRFEELYRTGYRRVYRRVWALAGQSAAEELTQDAFLRAHRNWAEVAELDDPLQWVSRVAFPSRRPTFGKRYGVFPGASVRSWSSATSKVSPASKPPPSSMSARKRSRPISTEPASLSPTDWRATHD